MRMAIAAIACFLWLSALAEAAFTDFSDYTQNTNFALGEVFQSNGISFKAAKLGGITNSVMIAANVSQGHSYLAPGPGVEFVLPNGVQEITFDYGDGAGLLLILNGDQPPRPGENGTPYHAGFSFLNGTTVAGVDVTTTTTLSNTHSERGTITFRGPISSLAISGLELSIDNVSVVVPEPGAGSLIALGVLGTNRLRRRRDVVELDCDCDCD
jgi:hypothetical protein